MINQRPAVLKTADATLTYAERGDIVVSSALAVALTLPSPNAGMWYQVSNAGDGDVSIIYNSAELTSISKEEAVLLLCNGTANWWYSKGGGGGEVTRESIEAVLTGTVTSHGHNAADIAISDSASNFESINVEDALSELFTSVSDGKTAVAGAVTDMGVATSATDSFEVMASNVRHITAGLNTFDATATAGKIFSGYTAYVQGAKITGTYQPNYPFGLKTDFGELFLGEAYNIGGATESATATYAKIVHHTSSAENNIAITLH